MLATSASATTGSTAAEVGRIDGCSMTAGVGGVGAAFGAAGITVLAGTVAGARGADVGVGEGSGFRLAGVVEAGTGLRWVAEVGVGVREGEGPRWAGLPPLLLGDISERGRGAGDERGFGVEVTGAGRDFKVTICLGAEFTLWGVDFSSNFSMGFASCLLARRAAAATAAAANAPGPEALSLFCGMGFCATCRGARFGPLARCAAAAAAAMAKGDPPVEPLLDVCAGACLGADFKAAAPAANAAAPPAPLGPELSTGAAGTSLAMTESWMFFATPSIDIL